MSSLLDPEIRELAAAAKRRRRVPPSASCTVCGGEEHLSRVRDEVRCYSHLRSRDESTELDHWAGIGVLPRARIPLSGNAHRDVTELRRLLGFDDLPPVAGDPQML